MSAILTTPDAAGGARGADLQRQLRWITIAWMFGAVWLWTVGGAAMNRFARELGTPEWGFGLLAALPFAGALLQLPGAIVLERWGHRRRLFLTCGTLGRFTWVALAAAPWVLRDARAWWWPTMALMAGLGHALGNFASPACLSWMADLVPRQTRGRFFGLRKRLGESTGLLATLGVGYVLDVVSVAAGDAGTAGGSDLMLKATSAILALGGLIGSLDILCFQRVRDDQPPPARPRTPLLRTLRQPLRDPHFLRYVAFSAVFMLSTGFIGQYVWQFVFDVAKLSNWVANLILIAIPVGARLLVMGLWGRLIDQVGKKPVLLICSAVFVGGSLGWLLVDEHHLWLGYGLTLISPLVIPGVELATFNILLDLSEQKGQRGTGPAYVAVNSIATAVGGIASGLLGAGVARLLGSWTWMPPLPLPPISYHDVLFVLSAVLRVGAVLLALSLHEPRATGTREAVRLLTVTIYSNLQEALLLPTRAVARVAKLAYRIR